MPRIEFLLRVHSSVLNPNPRGPIASRKKAADMRDILRAMCYFGVQAAGWPNFVGESRLTGRFFFNVFSVVYFSF